MTRHPTPRPGFTLIELLVVIALLSVLAALAAGTYFRIRAGQLVSTTETSMQKLNTGLDRIWSAERDKAEKEFTTRTLTNNIQYNALLNYCGGPNETDRAKAVWILMRMKNEFPQTFQEALSNVVLSGTAVTITLPAKKTFANVKNVAPADATEASTQAAMLLYLILTEKGSRGELFDADSMNAFTKEVTVGTGANAHIGKVFVDAWGTPITYARFLTNNELDEPPYTRYTAASIAADVKLSNNPFDPTARLVGTAVPQWTNRTNFSTVSGISTANMRRNFMAAVISAGPNKVWDNLNVGSSFVDYTVAATDKDDNLMGYRLRKQAARGD